MSKAVEFIEKHTKNCSNLAHFEDAKGNIWEENFPWLTPDQALRAVEIAREEVISKLRKWVSSKNERDSFTIGYIDRHFDELLKQAMKDE